MTNVSFSIHLRVSAYDNKKHSTASDFWQVFMYFFAVNVTECQNRRVALYCFIGGKMSKSISGKVLLCYLTACPLTICPPVRKDEFPTHYVAIFFSPPTRVTEMWNYGHCQNCVLRAPLLLLGNWVALSFKVCLWGIGVTWPDLFLFQYRPS